MAESVCWEVAPGCRLAIAASDDAICGLEFDPDWKGASADHTAHPMLVEAIAQLRAYFDGRLSRFDLPLALQGTAFQKSVWQALLTIPYGQTTTYGRLAARIGNPRAVRAVGAANGRNPIPIIVPCHRVVGADGSLVGFGGGLEWKRRLLSLEAKFAFRVRPASAQ